MSWYNLYLFFCSCFNRSHSPIQHQDTPASSDCPEEILCSESEVYNMLAALDMMKASGSDGISARMLKSTAFSIAPSLTKLFNQSLSTGILPLPWKKSLVVPIPKNQELSNPYNYRLISLPPIVSKILERHIGHLQHNHPLSTFQWGFLKGRSTITALLHMTDQWLQAWKMDRTYVPYFWLSQGFRFGASRTTDGQKFFLYISRWINNYLANRRQVVAVDGAESSEAAVVSGVQQGSMLGPLLFFIY